MLSSPYPAPPIRGWRLLAAAKYLFVAAGGVSILYRPPATYEDVPDWVTFTWGWAALLAGLAATLGVMRTQYKIEWIAAWFAGMGVAIYASISWALVFDSDTHLTRAAFLTALTACVLERALLLGRIDRIARERKETEAEAG